MKLNNDGTHNQNYQGLFSNRQIKKKRVNFFKNLTTCEKGSPIHLELNDDVIKVVEPSSLMDSF